MAECALGLTKLLNVKVGLHQESTLAHVFFAIFVDRLMIEVKEKSP